MEAHPGWTYTAGGLAQQPQWFLDLEDALAAARAWHAENNPRPN